MRAYGYRTTNVDTGMQLVLAKYNKSTGVQTIIADTNNVGSGSTGNHTLAVTDLSEVFSMDDVYELSVALTAAATNTCGIRNAEVEYTVQRPFIGN